MFAWLAMIWHLKRWLCDDGSWGVTHDADTRCVSSGRVLLVDLMYFRNQMFYIFFYVLCTLWVSSGRCGCLSFLTWVVRFVASVVACGFEWDNERYLMFEFAPVQVALDYMRSMYRGTPSVRSNRRQNGTVNLMNFKTLKNHCLWSGNDFQCFWSVMTSSPGDDLHLQKIGSSKIDASMIFIKFLRTWGFVLKFLE